MFYVHFVSINNALHQLEQYINILVYLKHRLMRFKVTTKHKHIDVLEKTLTHWFQFWAGCKHHWLRTTIKWINKSSSNVHGTLKLTLSYFRHPEVSTKWERDREHVSEMRWFGHERRDQEETNAGDGTTWEKETRKTKAEMDRLSKENCVCRSDLTNQWSKSMFTQSAVQHRSDVEGNRQLRPGWPSCHIQRHPSPAGVHPYCCPERSPLSATNGLVITW